jgi:uncharacterized Zn finger protein
MKSAEQQKGDPQVTAIRRAIDVRLKARMRDETVARAAAAHPDEDVINAYVEGWLEESKADSLTSHLVSCASCLHLTAQLIRFDPEMDEAAAPSADADQGPLQRFFDRLAGGVLPSLGEDAVFAYQDNGESPDNAEKSDSDVNPPDPENKST